MAETIGIEVFLGMDSQQLQAELQKAENQLKQFQNQLKKSTDTQDIIRLNKDIANTRGTIENLNSAMGNVAKKTGDATQSIVNLSRVAQDAPYGFIGIANNINPLLESFQRLQTETGSTSKALGSLVSGIAGPAGIGLAVGVATSLLTVYSKEIAEFFKSPTDKLKEFREELKKTNQEVFKIVGEIQANRTVGLNLVNLITGGSKTQQEEALKRLKTLYSDNKAIQDAKLGQDKQYYINLVNLAAKQEEAAGKEKNVNKILDDAYEERKKIISQRDNDLKNVKQEYGAGGVPIYDLEKVKKRIRDNAQVQLDEIDKTIVKAKMKQLEFLTTLTSFETTDKKTGKGTPKSTFLSDVKQYRQQFDKEFNKIKATIIGTKKPEQTIDAFINPKQKTPDKISPTGSFYEKVEQDNQIAANRIMLVKEQTQAYKDMADTVSNYATNSLMGLWSAMEQGMNIGEALGAMFTDLAKQIAAAAIKALIFKAILAAFSGGSSEAAAASSQSGSFFSIFKSLLGLPVTKNAQGGITNGPSWGLIGEAGPEAIMPLSKLGSLLNTTFNAGAMSGGTGGGNGQFVLRGNDLVLALQRSNYSLNLRRGA